MNIEKAATLLLIMNKPGRAWNRISDDINVDSGRVKHVYASEDGQVEAVFSLRNEKHGNSVSKQADRKLRLLLGDDGEWSETQNAASMANAVYAEIDLRAKTFTVQSSIVGLPPVFLYEDENKIVLASDIYLLAMVAGVVLRFSPRSLYDMCIVGHPIEHRTLFENVSMAPGGHSITVNSDGSIRSSRMWSLQSAPPLGHWSEFSELQMGIFRDSLAGMDLKTSFLSLTAGLDTRAIVADLIDRKRMLPAYTMSGKALSLDAKTARALCAAYGTRHHIIELQDEFYKKLDYYTSEASRLSGGLSSISQAHEIYLYNKVDASLSGRLSGNLGNQIGRGGTEKISMLNANTDILHKNIRTSRGVNAADHWYHASAPTNDGMLNYEFLLQHEVPFSSVGNYAIGNHFAVQQSPYATRRLIESVSRKPLVVKQKESLSLLQMRLKDLRHRFLGEAEARSFQVKLIRTIGGAVADIPINWGWRAAGGVSLKGILFGGLAFADALACSRGWNTGRLYKALQAVHIGGLHEYRSTHRELVFLKEFVHDTLLSQIMKNSGILDNGKIAQMLKEHYDMKQYHHKEISLAMDLALAQRNFKASVNKG